MFTIRQGIRLDVIKQIRRCRGRISNVQEVSGAEYTEGCRGSGRFHATLRCPALQNELDGEAAKQLVKNRCNRRC